MRIIDNLDFRYNLCLAKKYFAIQIHN